MLDSKAKRKLSEIQHIALTESRGIHKRIDENRELLELLQKEHPEVLREHFWIEGWLESQDSFLIALERVLGLPPVRLPSGFPRQWPGRLPEVTVNERWTAHAYPLQQVTVLAQGTRHSERADLIAQLEAAIARLKAGEDHGHEHDDDFGYSFVKRDASEGPSFFEAQSGQA